MSNYFCLFHTEKDYPHKTRDRDLLRLIQRIRSMSAAHKKGSEFNKLMAQIGLDKQSHADLRNPLIVAGL